MSLISRNTPTFSKSEVRKQHIGQAADGGLHFDGAAGYVSCGDSTILDGATKLSIEVIIQTTSTTEGRIIAKQFDSIAYALRNDAAGTLTASIGNGSSNVNVTTSGTYNDGKPHHVVVTWDNENIKIYVDGTQDGNGTLAGGSIQNTSDFLELGARAKSGSRNSFFNGSLYRARIYNKALTQTEVDNAYQRADVDFADQYGSQTELSTNSYTNSGFAGFSGSATGFTASGSASGNNAWKNQSFIAGKQYRMKFTVTDGESANLEIAFRSSTGGSGSNTGTIVSSTKGNISGNFLQFTETGAYEVILSDLGSAQSIRIYAGGDVGAVNISGFSIVQIGAVTDYCLSDASPTASLMLADRSTNAVDGTISSSGVEAISKPIQVNAVAARIGSTGGPETPADGELIASKVNVTTSGNGEVIVSRDSGTSILCQAQSAAGRIGTSSNHELQFTANNTVYARIKNNGRFGVNQGDPAQQLHVSGNGSGSTSVDSHGYGLRVSDSNHAHGAVDIVSSADTAQFIARSNVQGGFSFKSYASVGTSLVERLKIDATGEIYMGSSAQGVSIHGNTSGEGTITGINAAKDTYKKLTLNASKFDFKISGTAKATINDGGLVTLGVDADPSQTATPSMLITKATAPSDVNGYSQLVLQRTDGHLNADGAQIMFNQAYHSGNTDYPAPVAAIRGYRTGPDTAYGGGLKLCYQPNNAALGVATGFVLDGNGKVGIGELTPDTEGLEIVSSSADTSFDLNSQSDNLLVLRNSDSASANTGRFAGLQMKINSNSNAAEGTIRTEFTGDGDSSLIFSTTASGTGGDRLTIDKTGLATFTDEISCTGLTISNQTNTTVGTRASSKFDHYEEGTFTATLTASTPPTSACTTTANYTRIGNLVYVQGRFSNKDTSGASGAMSVTGLPFTAANSNDSNEAQILGSAYYNLPVSTFGNVAQIGRNTSTIQFLSMDNDAPWGLQSISAGTGRYLHFAGVYNV